MRVSVLCPHSIMDPNRRKSLLGLLFGFSTNVLRFWSFGHLHLLFNQNVLIKRRDRSRRETEPCIPFKQPSRDPHLWDPDSEGCRKRT